VSNVLGELTERKVLSLAQSMDAPVSQTLGTSESNHWSEWLQAEETITTHYDPILSRNADALTNVFLHPGIERQDDGLNPEEYTYAFDTAPLRIRGDRLGDDMNLWDRSLISDEVLRTSAGHTDDDAPSAEESRIRFMRELVKANPQLVSDPAVVALLGFDTPPVVIDQVNGPAQAPAAVCAPVQGEDRPSAGPPAQSGATPASPRPALTAASGGLAAVANVAVVRALEVAGGRLVKTYARDADTDRTDVYTALERPPEDNQVHNAMRGAWRRLPEHLAPLGDVDVDAVETALDTYTRHLLRNRRPHNPAALAALLDLGGLA
jgi:hypothetical protein